MHALDLDGLARPEVTFFGVREGSELLGVGALREVEPGHGEIKSMHTLASARGRGVGQSMVEQLLALARGRGYRRVSLETGTMSAFEPARRLYERMGFAPCAPFAEYTKNDFSMCMTIEL